MDKRAYGLVTASYWGFTLTDGALRMLVLLHFHALGYSAVKLAFLFLLYEFCGVLTNLFGGWIGSRVGLKFTLYAGLAIQVVALVMLSLMNQAWAAGLSVAYVMASQALSGIAKDLTKMSSKSAVKLLASEGSLFKWVAVLTGSKNTLKGVGFFLGGVLLSWLGFVHALWGMAGFLGVILLLVLLFLREDMGKKKTKTKFRQLFSKSREINWLSGARVLLFGARDVWFVVALPVFLASEFGWSSKQVGGFMAGWVILYGFVQASAPKFVKKNQPAKAAYMWVGLLAGVTLAMALLVQLEVSVVMSLLVGLAVFGFVFAINSSVHSFLILAYSKNDDIALDVGFYYMANAGGRLLGTLLSGLMFLVGGLSTCLWTSGVMLVLATLLTRPLSKKSDGES